MPEHADRQADRLGHPLRRVDDLYRVLIENVRDYAIFILDPEGRVASWNAGAERIKGFEESEIVGRHYSAFFPPEAIRAGEPEQHLEVATREGRYEGEGWRLRKDGSRFWAHVVLTALHDHDGRLVGFGKVTGDKTAERQAREALRSRERQLAEAQQIAPLGSWVYDVADDRVTWSEELHRIFGVATGTPLHLGMYEELLHPEDRDRAMATIRESMEAGTPFAFDHRILRGGEVRHIQSRGEAVKDEAGRVVRLVGTALEQDDLRVLGQAASTCGSAS